MSKKTDFQRYLWRLEDLDEALPNVARHYGITPRQADRASVDLENYFEWLSFSSATAGLEVENLHILWGELTDRLFSGQTLICRVGESYDAMVILRGSRKSMLVLDPQGIKVRLKASEVVAFFEQAMLETSSEFAEVEGLEQIQVSPRLREAVRRALNRDKIALFCLRVTVPPSARPFVFFQGIHIIKLLLGIVATTTLSTGCLAASWIVLGAALFSGTVQMAWLLAWAGLVLLSVPFQALSVALGGELSAHFGSKLREKTLMGTLLIEERVLQESGTGESLGRVLKSEELDGLFFQLSTGTISLLVQMATGLIMLVAFSNWLMVALAIGLLVTLFFRGRQHLLDTARWLDAQLAITHQLTETMLGHPTRVVQDPQGDTRDEDLALEEYLERSRQVDSNQVRFDAVLPWLWSFLAVAVIGWGFIFHSHSPWYVASAIGAVLVFRQSSQEFATWIDSVSVARWIWRQTQAFLDAADQGPPRALLYRRRLPSQEDEIIRMRRVGFAYPESRRLFRDLNLVIRKRDHILFYGDSGSGKSTLAAIMSGFVEPREGVLFAGGLDSHSLGPDGWRRTTGVSPQFNENYIFNGTLAFNLLLGRAWPPDTDDLEDAREVVRQLGLEPLVESMPQGLGQPMGETGWQLSHGERSRVFLARALLQDAPLLILDENLGSLDAQLAAQVLRLLTAGDKSLILITHQ